MPFGFSLTVTAQLQILLLARDGNVKGEKIMDVAEIVPIWEKYTLTIEEAAKYFQIGETKLRRLIENNPDENFILCNGNRKLIKRRLFEDYIDLCAVI